MCPFSFCADLDVDRLKEIIDKSYFLCYNLVTRLKKQPIERRK